MRSMLKSLLGRPFYGWWIVAGAIVSQFTWMAVSLTVVGVFLMPVVDDLGWRVWEFTLGTSLSAVSGAVSGVIAGQVVDRHGPRPLMLVGVAVTALCFLGLGWQSNLWVFLALYIVSGLAGHNLFGSLVANATVSKWFIAKRGWALAIGSTGISLAGIISPIAITLVVDTWDWRTGYMTVAAFVLVVVTPAAFVMRRAPEDYGLLPDGGASDDPGAADGRAEAPSLNRAQALRSGAFWLLTAGFGLNFVALSAILVHATPFVTEAGFSRGIAATALTVNGLGNLLSKAVWGYGLQRFETRRLALAAFSTSSAGVALMVLAGDLGQVGILFLGFFLYGFGFGGTIPISEFLWARYFGRRHIGAIRGISNPVSVVGTGVGPILLGAWFDLSGSYGLAFLAVIGAYMSGAALIGLSREPPR